MSGSFAITPSVQSPKAYDINNLSAVQLIARMLTKEQSTADSIRNPLGQILNKQTPEETTAVSTPTAFYINSWKPKPERYGAAGDGVTDDTAAIQKWANCHNTKGGRLELGDFAKYLIDSASVTIPKWTHVHGSGYSIFDQSNTTSSLGDIPGFRVNPAWSIVLSGSASLHDVAVLRKGVTGYANDASAFAGTAIKNVASQDDVTLSRVVALGFATLASFVSTQRLTVSDFKGDGLNGIYLSNSRDVSKISRVHLWCYITVGNGAANGFVRSGKGINFDDTTGPVDWAKIIDSFVYGYAQGYAFKGAANCSLISSAVDHEPTYANLSTTQAVLVDVGTELLHVDDCTIATSPGVRVQLDPSSSIPTTISNTRFRANSARAIDLFQGVLRVKGSEFIATPKGIHVRQANGNIRLFTEGTNWFAGSVTNPIYCDAASDQIFTDGQLVWEGGSGNNIIGGTQPIKVTFSATTTPVLPTYGKHFVLDSGQLNSLTGGYPGRIVHFGFAQACACINSASLLLSGAANFIAGTTSTLTLRAQSNGVWEEIARKA